MGLPEYRRRRRFDVTPEPAGKEQPAREGQSYCVQKHAATHLHYDFRLEMEGVLRSWAVPKGPSLDPAVKRLAAHVEDHPLEYVGFEGVIPKGHYGGGTVVLWDRGTWAPAGDPVAMYRRGRLRFHLAGEKLRGAWKLVRMGGAGDAGRKEWLLIKERDDEARPGRGTTLVDRRPESVATGRTLEEIAAAGVRVRSSPPAGRRRVPRKTTAPAAHAADADLSAIAGVRRAALPDDVEPELATLVGTAPVGAAWIHEIKFDGYRMLCSVKDGRARLTSRRGNDWTSRMPALAAAAAILPVREALLDGEAVLIGADGRSSFQALQNAVSEGRTDDVAYVAFDLLHLDGHDLRAAPLLERKRVLADVLGRAGPGGRIRFSDHVQGSGPAFVQRACELAVEGAVCKRADSPYVSGRGRDWLKVKCVHTQEVVIVGFTEPAGGRSGFGALLVGVHAAEGELRFAGKVGTGFTRRTHADLHRRLAGIEIREPLVVGAPRGAGAAGVRWVTPELVAEVSFSEWTRDGRLRHAAFKGLRTDEPAAEIVRERPSSARRSALAGGSLPEAGDAPSPATSGPGPRARGVRRKGSGAGAAIRGLGTPRGPLRTSAPTTSKARGGSSPVVAGVTLSHPTRVLYPGQGITKLELAHYYETVAAWMLPHVAGRPLTLVRCPQGQGTQCFFQRHATDSTSVHVRRVTVREGSGVGEGPAEGMRIDSVAGLVALVQMGVLEVHVWGSRSDDREHPDRLVFDLDPDTSVGWPRVVSGAVELRERLSELGLVSFVKTTGGKGLHVVVPVSGAIRWDDAKAFTRAVADAIVAEAPDRYTASALKTRRVGRIYIDYLRNGRGATAIAPYSTRAREGAPVALPIAWSELTAGLRPAALHVRSVPARLAELAADPWRDMATVRQRVSASARRKVGLA